MSIETTANHSDDIKHMLGEVIAHIADADKRSTASLRQMQERLEQLGQDARSVRASIPADYLPGFDRIEDGMSLLAARIAQSYTSRDAAAPATSGQIPAFNAFAAAPAAHAAAMPAAGSFMRSPALAPSFEPAAQPAFDTAVEPAYIPVGPASHARFDLDEPNPLSSSTPGLLRARSNTYAAGVDTFDVIETMPESHHDGIGSDNWSPDTAAALVGVYASDDAVPFHSTVTAPVLAKSKESEPAALDKVWLDSRLTDIATRVERSLAEGRSGKALASLEHRLDEFEQRMVAVLNGVASKQDVESLTGLETQIRDLRTQFELTHAELSRIDDLERQLAHIAEQTSEDNVGALLSRHVQAPQAPAARSDVDFHSVAIAAAEAAASRVASASNGRGNRVEDVHTLLAEFIQERRYGEEQTANTLDTLQQAMLRILDRVDAIDVPPAPVASAAPFHQPAHESLLAAAAAAPWPQPEPPRYSKPAPAPALSIEPETVAAHDAEPVPAGDYLAQQRAKMQASVQRAAAAQREKQAQQAAADKTPPPRPAGPAPGGGSRRLMVSSLALAVIAGGAAAFAVMSSGSRDTINIADVPAPQAISAPARTLVSSQMASAESETGTVSAAAQSAGGMPQTVDGALNDAVVSEPGRSSNSNYARTQAAAPGPLSGILLQDDVSGVATAPPGLAQPKATSIAAGASDLEQPAQSAAGTPARGSLDLPPATVGPLSLRLAAAQGDASAEFEVASRLAEGKGTDQNLKEAVRWYQRSATQGFAQAQYRLGTFFERGLGMKADPARARIWYQRAADQGNVKAMHNLAVLAADRSAESPDYATAARWFTQAASYGLPDSQFNLAVLTESGLGVEKDMVQAAVWFNLAARSGDKEATRRRDLMKSKMDAKDLAVAEHLVKSWQPLIAEKMANDPRAAGEAWKTRQAASPTGQQ